MNREEILAAVRAHVKNENLIKHMLATEAVMRAVARRLGQDEDQWGLAGLIHDIDVELTKNETHNHSKTGSNMAKELGASEAICRAVLCHNEIHGIQCQAPIEKALFCADPVTGLITAAALINPKKSVAELTASSLMKRFKEKRFASGANRDNIASCQRIDVELEEFLSLGIEAMKEIAPELGL